ncbi:hypothetical protein CVT25_014561, partial [Psilocybe cyanescens]
MLAAVLSTQNNIQNSLCRHSEHLRPLGAGVIIRQSVYCHLQLHRVSDEEVVVHPILVPTPFQPVPPNLAPGAPITLLPYATPAYFIANYNGPTSALAAQFRAQGITLPSSPRFIIAWIAVENSQGEDKGILIIYPTDLCLSSTLQRPFLQYIPELPPQLHQQSPLQCTIARPPLLSSPTSDSLHAFRAMTVNRTKPLRYVAAEVGGYVDAVARDRERERERLKRERESASSPKMSRASQQPLVSAPPPVPQPPPPPTPTPPATTISVQNFYPSPPQIPPAPPHDARTSPTIRLATPSPPPVTSLPPPPPPLPPPPTQPVAVYDPWPSSADPFDLDMVMDMDFAMDMDIGFGPDSAASSSMSAAPISLANRGGGMGGMGGGGGGDQRNAFEDAFTDDDFSFFDRPARPLVVQASVGTPAMSPPGAHHFGGEQHHHQQQQQQQPGWTPNTVIDPFPFTTPRSLDDPPDLVHSNAYSSPSPDDGDAQSPEFGGPVTPNVYVDSPAVSGGGSLLLRTPSGGLGGGGGAGGAFEPIPFAAYHQRADGKYAVGKFAFSSSFGAASWSPESSEKEEGWRARYDAVTDPRIGVVRKLIGVKRKSEDGMGMGIGRPPPTPVWEWEEGGVEDREMDDSDFDSDTGDDEDQGYFNGRGYRSGYGDDGMDEEDEEDAEDSPIVSRPATPPPAYLPLGPTLLQTRFEHRLLLPLSVPLRAPGAGVVPTPGASSSAITSPTAAVSAAGAVNSIGGGSAGAHAQHQHQQQQMTMTMTMTMMALSVPTPVSPAAMAGAEEEKARAMEAAGRVLAREVVENAVWARVWRAAGAGFGG